MAPPSPSDQARDVLVSTDWALDHLHDPRVCFVEVDVDTEAYEGGHIPGAIALNWKTQLQDQVRRDVLSRPAFETLISSVGIEPTNTVVLYGDNNNWFAAYAFWLFKLYGHQDVRLMDGGRVKWLAGPGHPLTTEEPDRSPTGYRAHECDTSIRARIFDVLSAVQSGSHTLIDVRSPDEFSGTIIAPEGMSESAQRAGHIPGAANVPWSLAVNTDGTFKTPAQLERLYFEGASVEPDRPAIVYCRIGERSSHTWFVLKHLLGVNNVRNYDGSWTEYGSMIGVPIDKVA